MLSHLYINLFCKDCFIFIYFISLSLLPFYLFIYLFMLLCPLYHTTTERYQVSHTHTKSTIPAKPVSPPDTYHRGDVLREPPPQHIKPPIPNTNSITNAPTLYPRPFILLCASDPTTLPSSSSSPPSPVITNILINVIIRPCPSFHTTPSPSTPPPPLVAMV